MSESATPAESVEQPQEGAATEQAKTFDAEYVEKLRKENAKYRTEAKANAEAAERLAQIEEASKTEAQKLADRLAAAEKVAADAQRDALRFRIASKFQISDEDAELFLTAGDEDTLTKQAERLAARNEDAGKPRSPKPDPNQGRSGSGSASTAELFGAAIESSFTR